MRIAADRPGRHEGRAVWLDGAVEILLDFDAGGHSAIAFAGNAAGAFGDGLALGTTDSAKSWNWDYRARETDAGWKGGLAIRFKDLGLDAMPSPGTTWGFDLVRNNKTPKQEAAFISYRDQWQDKSSYSRLVFGGDVPVVRLLQLGPVGDESMGILAESVNPGAQAAEIEVEYFIYRRRPAISSFNFFHQIDAGVSNRDTQDILTTATVEEQMAAALSLYDQVKRGQLMRTVAPGGRIAFNLTTVEDPVGDYMIGYRFRHTDGMILAEGLLPATRWDPLQVEVVPYYLKADLIDGRATIRSSSALNTLQDIDPRLLQDQKIVS